MKSSMLVAEHNAHKCWLLLLCMLLVISMSISFKVKVMDKTITWAPFYSKLMRFHSYNYNFDALNSSELSGSQEQSVKLCLSAWSWRNMRWKSHPLFWVHDDISTKKNQIVKADLLPLMTRPTNWLIFQKNLEIMEYLMNSYLKRSVK